ncbi:MAG: type IV pilus assembly protein PilQ [Candidatus Azotimanducaceae bacterium]|jgi:type IV pilus assembly protein PilQ
MAFTALISVFANSNKETGHIMLGRFFVLALTCLPFTAVAAVTMNGIEFSSLPGDKTEIRMQFDGSPPTPSGYTIEQPARIALDLTGVSSGLASKYHQLGGGNARSVTVIDAGDRTRVIVALTELTPYSTQLEGNTLILLVGMAQNSGYVAAESSAMPSAAMNMSQSVESDSGARVNSIDFRRGEGGEGRVIVDLSDPGVGVDVTSEGGKIRIEFSGTQIPQNLQRRLDVTDFATPVLIVDALPESNNTVLMIEPTGDYDYLAYQADNIFTLEVKPLTAAEMESNLDQAFRYRGEKLSLNFQDIEIRAVLQLIADFTDLNLVASDTVAGKITLRLKNVPWDQALDIIMKTKGLDKRQLGNVLMVAPAAELSAREQLELESREQISELAPLRTEFIEVKYANAAEIYGLFQSSEEGGGGGGVVSSRGSVIVDERTNSIILTDTAEQINEFRSVLDKLDVPVRQVMIEARIVRVSSSFSKDLGVRWGTGGYTSSGTSSVQVGSTLASLEAVRGSSVAGTDLALSSLDSLVVNLPGVATTNSIAFGMLNENFLLDLELTAGESTGDSEVVARPKVITADKQAATITQGQQIPYLERAGGDTGAAGGATVAFIPAVLNLTVTPQITPDDRIILDLNVTQDTPAFADPGVAPAINTSSLITKVLVGNGETIVLGGVFLADNTENIAKTPFFGDLPLIGKLFRVTSERASKSELLIFITPVLLEDPLADR